MPWGRVTFTAQYVATLHSCQVSPVYMGGWKANGRTKRRRWPVKDALQPQLYRLPGWAERAGSKTTATAGSSKTGERCEHGNDDCESRCRGPSSRGDGDEHWTGCEHHRGLRGLCRSCIRGAAEREGKEYWL
ncbi:hypothetical protein J6590_049747 [Homalodisca vitripennis]|nr:hypothetical protein J6590_049747 [Homalodisca vitripennis]